MFFKKHEITQGRVRDKISFREGGEVLTLRVDGDAMRFVAGLTQAQEILKQITVDSTDEEIASAARFFATVIFGDKQADQLMEFYMGDGGCVVNVCGKYFRDFLLKKVTKAQKRMSKK